MAGLLCMSRRQGGGIMVGPSQMAHPSLLCQGDHLSGTQTAVGHGGVNVQIDEAH